MQRGRIGLFAALALASLALIPARAAAQEPAVAPSDESRYSLVHGCFALSPASGGFVAKQGPGYVAGGALAGAEPFRMQATALGKYLLYGTDRDFMALDGDGIAAAAEPSNDADWTVEQTGDGEAFTITNGYAGKQLAVGAGGALVAVAAGSAGDDGLFGFEGAEGCPAYPEIDTNVSGAPSKGSPRYGETRGFLEAHLHHMAFEFLGGGAHCGRPWHRFGVPYAMQDCPDHEPDGCAAILENALYGDPARCHDTTGWPEFTDWPDPRSLTHEQTYYKWVERAWAGGLRIFVNLMVQNRALCEIYPIKRGNVPCDDAKTVDLEIKDAYALEDYIDAQAGGPGEGFYRIVTNPFQARKVINGGKLAVVLGMEVSEPFGCRMFNRTPTCDSKEITDQIQHLYDQGVRQMELINKFDNAISGVAGDSGSTGTLTNSGNFYATGQFWDMEPCSDPENHDHTPTGVEVHNDDLIVANAIQALVPGGVAPVYPAGPLCNTMGLTDLGKHAIDEMIERGMIFDPDHMSVLGRNQAMDVIEAQRYAGVISSHSWSTPNALPRIYGAGGIVAPYAGDSTGFVDKWKEARLAYEGRQYFGLGYGADMNGLGGQGTPRGADVSNPVSYPFESFDGKQTIDKQTSGNRVYDINVDGVAHYGLYPDWIEDLRMLAGDKIVEDMVKGSEAYLQMWERAEGVPPVRCPSWHGDITRRGLGKKLRVGKPGKKVLYKAGQPVTRERVWRWCTRNHKSGNRALGGRRNVVGVFDTKGKLRLAASSLQRNEAKGAGRGDRLAEIRGRADKLGGGIWARGAGKGRKFVYGVRKGKIRFAAIADRKVSKSRAKLRRYAKRTKLL